MNLTAVRGPEEIVTRHFGESLFAAQALFPGHVGTAAPGRPAHVGAGAPACPAERSSARSFDSAQDRLPGAPGATQPEPHGCPTLPLQRRMGVSPEGDGVSNVSTVADVGSGAGFPGLPIKIWAPEIRLALIESNHKKATFLREVVRTLGLERVEVFSGRAETFPAASADVVTLRAVERFEEILPIAAGLVKPGGRLALLIGNSQVEQARSLVKELNWQAPVPVPLSNNRVVLAGKTLMCK